MADDRYYPPDRLRTDRLTLRPSSVGDADAIYSAYATDPDVTCYLGWRPHGSVNDTVAYLERCEAKRAVSTDFAYVLEDGATGELLGMIDAHVSAHAVGYGYVLRRESWGRGLMTEALDTLVADALAYPAIYRAHAVCDVDNPASARVMEKAGMAYEGVLRRYLVHPNVSEEPRDCLAYARVR